MSLKVYFDRAAALNSSSELIMRQLNIKLTSMSAVLRWLHLTDLHIGKKDESQETALASLLSAVDAAACGVPFDLVLLSGDLAYSGKKDEFDQFEKTVISPLRSSPLFGSASFAAVPGNHDLDCSLSYPVIWTGIGKSRQDTFFHLDDAGTATRSPRAPSFAAYADFAQRAGIITVDPTKEPAILVRLRKGDQSVALILTVTSFFSDWEVSDENKAPAPVHPIRTIVQELEEGTLPIVMGHHPIGWFTQDTQTPLRTLLVEKRALYINGHEHRIETAFGGRGLISIGFGAAYQGSIDAPPKVRYRNSFAICELADALHVSITSWDGENGAWRSDSALPVDFSEKSERLANGYRFALPSSLLANNTGGVYSAIASSVRPDVRVESCIWIGPNEAKRWNDILTKVGQFRGKSEIYTLGAQALPAGHIQYRVKDQRGSHLVYAITGVGDILNYEQLQTINTQLDKQNFDGCVIATMGELSEEAHTLANQLSRKAIVILEREDIVRKLAQTNPLRKTISGLDLADTSGALIISPERFDLLLQDRTANAWFKVVNDQGVAYDAADEIVQKLCMEMPRLRTQRYASEKPSPSHEQTSDRTVFDRTGYLASCRDHFDDVRYAPLAALGLKFRKASLSEVYVSASADVQGASKSTQSLNHAIAEFMDSLRLNKSQRDQVESQLRQKAGVERAAEVGAASQLYQRYNSVVVLGDPGSGKTCFIKHELLAYCSGELEGASWYAQHLPIYLSLAEAARLVGPTTSLIEICEVASARRGIRLPKEVIVAALTEGRAACFFDGLDEVGVLEKRTTLMAEIDSLVKAYAHKGSRFVIASRPAAAQAVEIPEGMTYLHLKGLTEDEMRVLAGRVLTVRLGESEADGVSGDESQIVERLLEDTRTSPGIARIARNPLLLTLLVLIYANSGALSAKRHIIYTQAVKTLVSVRGRDSRESQLSEADLRIRLGALAVAIFSREIAEIPKRSEVIRVLAPYISKGGKARPIRRQSMTSSKRSPRLPAY